MKVQYTEYKRNSEGIINTRVFHVKTNYIDLLAKLVLGEPSVGNSCISFKLTTEDYHKVNSVKGYLENHTLTEINKEVEEALSNVGEERLAVMAVLRIYLINGHTLPDDYPLEINRLLSNY